MLMNAPQIYQFDLNGLDEDKIWRTELCPLLEESSPNVFSICQYGITEILNNAIDHSGGSSVTVKLLITPGEINISIADDGLGIFKKIQQAFNLDDERHAILELCKGKLTTDPQRHSGEGIFFTSRMFDVFSIISHKLCFFHYGEKGEWLLEDEKTHFHNQLPGTTVLMEISRNSSRTSQSVFDTFADPAQDFGFSKTQIPVFLALYGNEKLFSRSQAKRILARMEHFQEVILDFQSIDIIGQGFADEMFRVFPNHNPHVRLSWMNTTTQIENMIKHVRVNLEPKP